MAMGATIEVGAWGGAGRQAPAHRGVDHGDRMRQRAEAVKAEANEVSGAAKRCVPSMIGSLEVKVLYPA